MKHYAQRHSGGGFRRVAWEKNLSRIHTISARASLTIESDENEKCRDRDGNPCRKQTAQLALWRDGGKQRFESTFDRTFNADHEVVYNYAFIEHLVKVESAKATAVRQATSQTTVRQLWLADAMYRYRVESKSVDILPPDSPTPLDRASEWLVTGPDVHGRTLRRLVVEALKPGMAVTVEDAGKGQYVLVITRRLTLPDGRLAEAFTRVLIDTDKGYTIQRVDAGDKGRTAHGVDTYDYVMIGGAWALTGGDLRMVNAMGKEVSRSTLTVDRNSLKVNETIDPAVFTVDDLHIAKGALVDNVLTLTRSLYNDVSIAAKIEEMERSQAQAQPAELPRHLKDVAPTTPAAIPAAARPVTPTSADASHWWIVIGCALAAVVMGVAVAIRHCRRRR